MRRKIHTWKEIEHSRKRGERDAENNVRQAIGRMGGDLEEAYFRGYQTALMNKKRKG